MEVSLDTDVVMERSIHVAAVFNHIVHPMRLPDRSQAGRFNTYGRAYAHVSPKYLWRMFPFMNLRQAT